MKNTINTLIKKFMKNDDETNVISYQNLIKSLIKDFFTKNSNKSLPSLTNLNITNFDFKFEDDIIEVTITLTEVGLLVGKEGRTIKQLAGFLSKTLDKKIRVFVKESDLFKINEDVI